MTSPPSDVPAFVRLGPADPPGPVVVAVPHAGRHHPPALLAHARAPLALIEGLEDRHVDRLVGDGVTAHAAAFVAQVARGWIDLNRHEREIDRTMMTPPPPAGAVDETVRVRGGLGLVPRTGAGGVALWRGPFAAADIADRIARIHRPWHAALAAALAETRARFGVAVLLDLHSMPSLRGDPGRRAGLVVGDRMGLSADLVLRRAAVETAAAAGLRPAVNQPYAGGHTLDRHGRPGRGIHAVQIEIDRALYLDADGNPSAAGVAEMRRLVADLVRSLAEAAQGLATPLAAE